MHRIKLRKYFSALSKLEGYDNWVIAKVHINISRVVSEKETHEDNVGISVFEKKKKKNYALIAVKDSRLSFEVHLIRIISKSEGSFNVSQLDIYQKSKEDFLKYLSDENIFLSDKIIFKKDEITGFVNEVGDENPIHRTRQAVVPGLLIFERLFEKEDILSCEIKYILPVFENEEIEIYDNGGGIEAWVWRSNNIGGYVKVFEMKKSVNF